MKFFTNKSTVQKIIIVLVLMILCNFIMPTYSVHANVLTDAIGTVASGIGNFITEPLIGAIVSIIDAAFNGVQNFMIGRRISLKFYGRQRQNS